MMLTIVATSSLSFWWWMPAEAPHPAPLTFGSFNPAIADVKIESDEQLRQQLRISVQRYRDLSEIVDWPDFDRFDVVAIPLNGLPGELSGEYRIRGLTSAAQFAFTDMALTDAIAIISRLYGIPIELDHDVLLKNPDSIRVSHCARGRPLWNELSEMLSPLGLSCGIYSDAVLVTTKQRAEAIEGPNLIYSRLDPFVPDLASHCRAGGMLLFVTGYRDATMADSRGAGFSVPKRAHIVYARTYTVRMLDLLVFAIVATPLALTAWWTLKTGPSNSCCVSD